MNWFAHYKKASKGKIIAYHTTVAGKSILESGFKTRQQLSGKSALGGGTDNSLSFTTDWAVAKGIYDAFILAANIANAKNPLEFIKNHFYSLKPEEQTKVASMLNAFHGKNDSNNLDNLFSGTGIDGTFGFNHQNPKTIEELNELNYTPVGEPLGNKYYSWKRPLTEKEIDDLLYSYLKSFHAGANVYNPVFFGTNISNFKNINKDNIGILSAEIDIDPDKRTQDDYDENADFRYVTSMAEIRIFNTSIIHIIDFDTKPGNRPKHTSNKSYFSNLNDRETNINELLNYIYKHYNKLYKFFTEHSLAIDSIISLFQYYGDTSGSEIWQIINTIENQCQFKHSKFLLEQYLKYHNRTKVPKEILQYLNGLPSNISNRILNGEKADDVLFEFYESNNAAYDTWWSSQSDAYKTEQTLNEWSKDRKHDLSLYKTYGEQNLNTLKELFGNNDYNVIYGLILNLEKVKKSI